jgi:hypothetical protein
MNPSVEHLPWRLAAVAGLAVGAVSLWAGVDLWAALLRVGAAFVVFGLGGLGLRAVLRQSAARGGTPPGLRPGAHMDETTPPMRVEDVSRPAEGAGRRGDDSE